MNKIKCECGHVNPEGTVLCESCGKPIEENQHLDKNNKKKLLNMRYDGSARRSQTYNQSIIDKTWNFFSSVKVGVWLIVIALIASALGTIYPQEMYIPVNAVTRDPAIYYEAQFGLPGKIYYQLGFHNLYSSWWYMLLIALIGVSLVICSIDRVVPLHRALKLQKPKRHETFVNRQRYFSETKDASKEDINKFVNGLKKARYRIHTEDGHVLAEKGRFSRWGPYVNHIGLIIILLAAMLRMTSFMFLDEYVWVREGQQVVIPGTDNQYFIENKNFILETYDPENDERFRDALEKQNEMVPSNFQTDVIISKVTGEESGEPTLEPFIEDEIRMNHPLKFDGFTLYQQGYQLNEFSNMSFKLYRTDDEAETAIDTFTIDLTSPERTYELEDGIEIEVAQYFPDYVLDDGEPRSETNFPRNPAFVIRVNAPDLETSEVSFIGIGKNIDATGENQYKLGIVDFETHNVSGLTVRKDYTLPLFGIGAAIFMIGVIQGMYWQHRRVWIHPKNNDVLIAAHTNKNWFGIKRDIETALKDTDLKMVIDQQDEDEDEEI
ncbi:cytochrome c biogenesis protein ResB [Ornithinibacillus sp. 4-3]|uniref:Cytochrome c biogenesis protein ResB n=1 Tax=Ornithinibacillus sp. 4-3 TaxID=3231488 RepID=A0AB39HGE2_9BACI